MPRILYFLLILGLFWQCHPPQRIVLEAEQSFTLLDSAAVYRTYRIKNRSAQELALAVLRDQDGERFSGFGLSARGEATVKVPPQHGLYLKNEGQGKAKISLKLKQVNAPPPGAANSSSRDFTLRNNSPSSIPLIIPGVMNPNLSPMSNSRVNLALGQELFFRYEGKKYLLLKVDERIAPGEIVDVSALLKKRKKELGLR